MMHINTEQAIKDIQSSIGQLTPKQNASAISRALNRGINAGRTRANKLARETYNLTKESFDKKIVIEKATKNNLFATMKVSRSTIAISNVNKIKQTEEGVSAQIIKKKRTILKGAFIHQTKGFVGVFARGRYTGDSFEFRRKRIKKKGNDLDITALRTISPAGVMANPTVYTSTRDRAIEIFSNRYSHEIKKILKI
jgi:ribosomal protein L20A (L18A)